MNFELNRSPTLLVIIGKELSKKFTLHVQMVTVGTDVIVTQITTAICGNVATVHTALVFRMQSFNYISLCTENSACDRFYILVARQMKTINYCLSSQKCLEEGWTIRPPSPLMEGEQEAEVFEPQPVLPPWADPQKVTAINNIVQCYIFFVRVLFPNMV